MVQGPPSAARLALLSAFQQPMAALLEGVQNVDIRHFETLSATEAWRELLPVTSELVQQARTLVGAILETCEKLTGEAGEGGALHESFLPFERAIDAAVLAGDASVRAAEDVTFLVQLELRQRHERLRRLSDTSDALGVIGECDSALRRIRKGFGAIDVAIARAEAVPPRLDFSSELQESLRVREAYAKFRARLVGDGTPAPAELYGRMRAAGTQIAVLVGWSVYPLLRVRDRLQLRQLQQRILAWLRPEHRSDEVAGMRLWQDVVSFVDMLAQVNRRQELLEHDARLVQELLGRLPDADGDADEASTRAALPLKGLDDDLDRWLAAPGSLRDLRDAIRRVGVRLGVAPAEAHP